VPVVSQEPPVSRAWRVTGWVPPPPPARFRGRGSPTSARGPLLTPPLLSPTPQGFSGLDGAKGEPGPAGPKVRSGDNITPGKSPLVPRSRAGPSMLSFLLGRARQPRGERCSWADGECWSPQGWGSSASKRGRGLGARPVGETARPGGCFPRDALGTGSRKGLNPLERSLWAGAGGHGDGRRSKEG